METNTTTTDGESNDGQPDKHAWVTDIETIEVNADAVVKYMRINNYASTGHMVRLVPSAGETNPVQTTEIYEPGPGEYYDPDMSSHPIHIRPRRFLPDDFDVYEPTRSETREAVERHQDDQLTEEELDEHHETAMEVYREEVKSALVTSINLFRRGPTHEVEVEYQED